MTVPFEKPTAAATSSWIVHAVGSAVEIVHIGAYTAEIGVALDRMVASLAKSGHTKASILVDPHVAGDRPVGVRVDGVDGNSDAIWRVLVVGFADDTKIDAARILLGINRIAYIAISRAAGRH